MKDKVIGVAAVLALTTGCGADSSAPKGQSVVSQEATLGAIREAENAQMDALSRGDLDLATAVYAPGARFYAPGSQLAFGREDIRNRFKAMLADKAYDVLTDSGSRQSWVSSSGDLAATGFTGQVTRTVDGKVVTDAFVNRTIWVRQPDGEWRMDSDVNAIVPSTKK